MKKQKYRLPVYAPVKRPPDLPETPVAAPGRHRPHSVATDGTGLGEYSFFQANQHRPSNSRVRMLREEEQERVARDVAATPRDSNRRPVGARVLKDKWIMDMEAMAGI